MSVKIRLSRYGKIHSPVFRIIAVDSRKKRDGAFLENLGTYNPLTGELVQFHEERINDWISKGAQESDTVKRLHKDYLRRKAGAAAPKAIAKKSVEATPAKAASEATEAKA